jgi:hypothetical protein
MSNEPDVPPRPRRPFEDAPKPEAFHRSPEFQRLIWFACLLVFIGLFVFYLLETSSRSHPPKESAPTAVAPTPAELEARATKLRTLFEGSLADTQNGEGFRETQGYWRLIQLLTSYSPEEVDQRAVKRLDYDAVLRDPDAWRGEFVTVRGVPAFMYTQKLSGKVFGIGDVYRGFLTDADGDNGIVFDLPEPPPAFEMRRTPIDIDGVLYRTVRYETQQGKVRVVPYLLARTMRVVLKPKVGTAGFLKDHGGTLLVLMGLAIFSARLLMYVFQRRARRRAPARPARHAGFHEMFEAKLRDERRPSDPRPPA